MESSRLRRVGWCGCSRGRADRSCSSTRRRRCGSGGHVEALRQLLALIHGKDHSKRSKLTVQGVHLPGTVLTGYLQAAAVNEVQNNTVGQFLNIHVG